MAAGGLQLLTAIAEASKGAQAQGHSNVSETECTEAAAAVTAAKAMPSADCSGTLRRQRSHPSPMGSRRDCWAQRSASAPALCPGGQ